MPFIDGPRRARKDEGGNTYYPCTWLGCDKTFGSAGHVRRHERSHAGTTPYACPYCDKRFGRSDVRAKHVASMHATEASVESSGSEEPPSKSRRRESMSSATGHHHDATSRSSMDMSHHPPPPPQQPAPAALDLTWPLSTSPHPPTRLTPTHSHHSHGHHLSQSHHHHSGHPHPQQASPQAAQNFMPDLSVGGMTLTQQGLMLPPATTTPTFSIDSGSTGFLDPSNLSTGASTMPHLDPGPMLNPVTPLDPSTSWDLFGQVFGWGLDNELDLETGLQNSMFDLNEIGPVSSTENLSAAWLLAATPRGGSPVNGEEAKRDPFGRDHDTPWPQLFRPKDPDRALTLCGVKASPRADRPRPSDPLISQTVRNAMLSLVYLSHQGNWLMPDIEDFPDHDTLSDFVDLYFEKFHPTFPILHRPTFFSGQTPVVLLLAAASIGATFADREFKPLAVALSELVRRMVQWMRASDQRAKFDRYQITAYTLQTALGLACGSREMHLHAEISRGSISTMCRRMHLMKPGGRSAMDDLFARESKPSDEERWAAWIEDEGKMRLGWGIHFIDSQVMALLNISPIMTVREIAVPLPDTDELWQAPDATTWATLYAKRQQAEARQPRRPFTQVFASALAGKDDLRGFDDFSCGITAFSAYRLMLEANILRGTLELEDGEYESSDTTSDLPSPLTSKPAQLLLHLARTTLPLASPTHLRLSPAALYHHAHLTFISPGLLEHVKSASGRYEPGMDRRDSLRWLKGWMRERKREVRTVLWHAGVLNALLTEFSGGAMAELFWTFDCALVLWAIVKYGSESIQSTELRSALFAANWFDTEPAQVWIDHGGQIVLPYLGSSSTLTVKDTLKLFMDRLEISPWGLAAQFRQVLKKLWEAEDKGESGD